MDKLDILDRIPFIERTMNLLRRLRDNRQSMAFSINGKWGCGKTFVLDLLAKRIKEENETHPAKEKQFIFIRYDCWKYDYYSEPVVALVSAMQDAIQGNTKEGNIDYVGRDIEDIGKKLGTWLLEKGGKFLDAQFGIDICQKLIDTFIKNNPEECRKGFDSNYSLTKALEELRNIMKSIAKNETLIVVVDELDRCLPEYMIRVLERLHHLFEGIDNIILIIATDRTQLEHTIRHVYGEKTDAFAYLQKIIQFEVSLGLGMMGNEMVLRKKFEDYLMCFDEKRFPSEISFNDFFYEVFKEIEIRRRIQWIEKIALFHRLSFGDRKVGYDILYYELFWTVFTKIYGIVPSNPRIQIDVRSPFIMFCLNTNKEKSLHEISFISYLEELFKKIWVDKARYEENNPIIRSDASDLNMMFWYWTRTTSNNSWYYSLPAVADDRQFERLESEATQNLEYIKQFQALMENIN